MEALGPIKRIHSLKLTASLPLKMGRNPKGNVVFQSSIFRGGNFSFREDSGVDRFLNVISNVLNIYEDRLICMGVPFFLSKSE